jgi:hypothetical protein
MLSLIPIASGPIAISDNVIGRDVSPVGRRPYGVGTYSAGYGIGQDLASRSQRRSSGRSTAVADEDLRSLCRKSRKSSAQNA